MLLLKVSHLSRCFAVLVMLGSSIAYAHEDIEPHSHSSNTEERADTSNEIVNTVFDSLSSKSRDTRMEGINTLLSSDAPRQSTWINALIAGSMYRDKTLNVLVIAEKHGKRLNIYRADTGEFIDSVKKRRIKRISIDNRMRSHIKNAQSTKNLNHSDDAVRLKAMQQLLRNPDEALAELIQAYLELEENEEVRREMSTFVAIAKLKSTDPSQQLQAIQAVQGNLNPVVKAVLESLASEQNSPEVSAAAQSEVNRINNTQTFYGYIETLFFGLSLGSVLVLAAIGLAITFGVMGVINMAHGELIMLGAYTAWAMQLLMPDALGVSLLLAIPAAFIVSGSVGVLIERSVIRHLYGRPLETLLATFGISLILQQAVRTFISTNNVAVSNPSWMSGSIAFNEALTFTTNRVIILVFCLGVFAALYWFLRRSAFGLQMRAVAQNRRMSNAMGIRSRRVDALTFGLGSGIAGVAGVALSQLTNVGPNLGRDYIIDSFLVVVFGGVGNLWGTLVAGMSLGIFNKVLEPWAGAVLAKVLVLVSIILFIQRKPRGLFPQRGRAAEA